jgi:PPM family protein phosphatase
VASDRGRARANNEDASFVDRERGLFILSDGMGGQQGGAVASKLVVSLLPALLARAATVGPGGAPGPDVVQAALRLAVQAVNAEVRARGEGNGSLRGLGATVALALIEGATAHIAHLGDSRVYLMRGPQLRRLTADHTLAALQRLDHGRAAPGERHRLVRCVGMDGPAEPDLRAVELQGGDRLLLCTDGVSGVLPDQLIAHLLRHQAGPDEACRALVGAARFSGGRDDATALAVWVDAVAGRSAS